MKRASRPLDANIPMKIQIKIFPFFMISFWGWVDGKIETQSRLASCSDLKTTRGGKPNNELWSEKDIETEPETPRYPCSLR